MAWAKSIVKRGGVNQTNSGGSAYLQPIDALNRPINGGNVRTEKRYTMLPALCGGSVMAMGIGEGPERQKSNNSN